MNTGKAEFLKKDFIPLLAKIPSDTKPNWGKMTLQQMIEHFSDAVRIASGKTAVLSIVTPEAHLQKMQDFIMSDKPFRENTVNVLLPETPAPVRNKTIESALKELQSELAYFFTVFENAANLKSRNPIFGDLSFEQNIHLLYKHAQHHLRQFGIDITVPTII
ncbi:MAG TPA: hypothetical protein VM888_14440 [Chitinophagaceae bacterium]|jgi:hypothetical protein|nr:hypothetical protein [Chitinophagaceae bacterium]